MRTITAIIVFTCVFTASLMPGTAEGVEILTDAELDSIHAGGLLLDFGIPKPEVNFKPGTLADNQFSGLKTASNVFKEAVDKVKIFGSDVVGQTPASGAPSVHDPIQLDLVVDRSASGNMGFSMGSPVSTPENVTTAAPAASVPSLSVPSVAPTGNIGTNIVAVDDLAQQNLSALVNVNAAGSIVPVMINITINMNSEVGSLNTTNNLDLNNYYSFNAR